MIKKLRCSLLSNEKPQDENVMWIDTSNPESFTLKLFRNGDWKPLHVVGTTRDMIERELTGYVTSHYHSYDKIINKPTTLIGYGITDCFNKTEIESLLNKKVTKVSGKSLSTNDFTNEDKSKLTNLKNYDDTQIRELIAGKANLQHQHTVADITDFPELYYDATTFFTSKIYPSDKYKELLEAVKAKKTVYAIIDEEGYVSYVFFTSSTNSDGLSSRVLLTTMFADGGYLYMNTFVLQQSGMTTLRENITGKANKATTLAGYGIGDAYTKSEVNTALNTKQNTISDLETIRSNAQKGNVASSTIASIVKAGYVFAGVATPATDPSTPNAKVFYIANGKGTYKKFGDLEVTEDEVVVLYWDSSWHKVSTGIASQEKLSELDEKLEDISDTDYQGTKVVEVNKVSYLDNVTQNVNGVSVLCKLDGTMEISGIASSSGGRTRKLTNLFHLDVGTYKTKLIPISVGDHPTFYIEDSVNTIIDTIAVDERTLTIDTAGDFYIGISVTSGVEYNSIVNPVVLKSETKEVDRTAKDEVARQKITFLSESFSALNTFPDYPEQVGYIDSSNKIVSWGQSRFKSIPLTGGNTIEVSKKDGNPNDVNMFVLKTFSDNPKLPYTPDFATGETGLRFCKTPIPSIFKVSDDARFLLINVKNVNGIDISPYQLFIDGKDVLYGAIDQVGQLHEKVSADFSLPVKVERLRTAFLWSQGASLVGDKIVGFNSANDDHSTNGSYRVYSVQQIEAGNYEPIVSGIQNISHANSVDYCKDTDTLAFSGTMSVASPTHNINIYLVEGASSKIATGEILNYADAVTIPINGLNGNYTGCNCFGEREDILYLVTLQDAGNYQMAYKKWVYKVQLGMGNNDFVSLFPGTSFGTFISGRGDNEYNGTARILSVYTFELPCEIQGGKYITGKLVLPIDIRVNEKEKAYILSLKLYGEQAIIDSAYLLPSDLNDGTIIRTESEDFVIVNGNRILHQVIFHADTNIGKIYEYYL